MMAPRKTKGVSRQKQTKPKSRPRARIKAKTKKKARSNGASNLRGTVRAQSNTRVLRSNAQRRYSTSEDESPNENNSRQDNLRDLRSVRWHRNSREGRGARAWDIGLQLLAQDELNCRLANVVTATATSEAGQRNIESTRATSSQRSSKEIPITRKSTQPKSTRSKAKSSQPSTSSKDSTLTKINSNKGKKRQGGKTKSNGGSPKRRKR